MANEEKALAHCYVQFRGENCRAVFTLLGLCKLLEYAKQRTGKDDVSLADILNVKALDPESLSALLWACLVYDKPDLTLEEVKKFVDMHAAAEFMAGTMRVVLEVVQRAVPTIQKLGEDLSAVEDAQKKILNAAEKIGLSSTE